jgi:hypothetical protein
MKDRRLWELVKQVGEPPAKGSKGRTAYWELVRQLCNADTKLKPYRTWRGLEEKYKRLLTRLKRFLPMSTSSDYSTN